MRNLNPNRSVADIDRLIIDARSGSAAALNELLEMLSTQLWAEHSRRSKPQDLGPSRGLSDLIQETLVQARANFDRFERDSFADFKQWARTDFPQNAKNGFATIVFVTPPAARKRSAYFSSSGWRQLNPQLDRSLRRRLETTEIGHTMHFASSKRTNNM